MILVFDTANNEKTFLGLWEVDWLSEIEWEAGRNLSADIMIKMDQLFEAADKDIKKVTGVIINSGPGSFTGLRIGISVANAISYCLDIPIVGVIDPKTIDSLLKSGYKKIKNNKNFIQPVKPEYGREPNISQPKNIYLKNNSGRER